MSTAHRVREELTGLAVDRAALVRLLFGDRTGLTIYLGALALFALYWRVDIFIVDTFAIGNALVALSEGQLHISQAVYGPTDPSTPGMNIVDGRLYARNYGHVVFALPFLWGLEALALVADPRIAIAALWSLLVLAVWVQFGRLVGRRRLATAAGCALAFGLFQVNLATATAIPPRLFPLLALQASTMVAAGFVPVVLYRLFVHAHGRRVAIAAGITGVVLVPIGFWASIPKRHAITALFALVALYGFYRSRVAIADGDEGLAFRSLAYAAVGATAWIHAPEALALLAVLLPADLLTARSRDPRTLGIVGGVFLLSLVPFFVTNTLISGNPVKPPRLLSAYTGGDVLIEDVGTGAGASGAESAGGASAGGTPAGESGDSMTEPRGPITRLVGGAIALASTGIDGALHAVDVFGGLLDTGLDALDSDRLTHVFLRSGRIPGVDYGQTGGQTVELTIAESAPVLGALVAAPFVVVGRIARSRSVRQRLRDPLTQTDVFAGCYVCLFSLMYLSRLPLHSTITVRYLAPIVPVLVYGVFRLEPIQRIVDREWRPFVAATCGFTAVGIVAAIAAFSAVDVSVGTVVQTHAIVNLCVAGVLASSIAVAARTERWDRVGALALALAVAAMAVFLLLSGVEYFGSGRQFALPITDLLERYVSIRNP
ncbi:hypothetical protein [Natrinema salaciae]|uniref:4-amino-4-deoxy-L-arabinose transferase n=1 Tax=Natrinema salaciae TaxID=1186196 RepID=A0A1H9M7P8_9EURY|nr:hypothetical protein [Natrinema salaciae]SER19716.1 hypothetical protein SAMN04489841_3240 [Natrinema salaciae]